MDIYERAETMTHTIRDIIGHHFDGERVELYIQSELREAGEEAVTYYLNGLDEMEDE